jgi:hypothetical protein
LPCEDFCFDTVMPILTDMILHTMKREV